MTKGARTHHAVGQSADFGRAVFIVTADSGIVVRIARFGSSEAHKVRLGGGQLWRSKASML